MSEKQFVVFKLGNEEYGIDIMNVKEIGPFIEAIKVPNTPEFIEGIVNYRGSVIPIINLKKKFKINETNIQNEKRIIYININDRQIGFIVDEASQTIRLYKEEIEPTPDMITDVDKKFITGVGKKEERLIILIDLEKVLNDKEKNEVVKIG